MSDVAEVTSRLFREAQQAQLAERFDEAEGLYKEALDLAPESAELLHGLGNLHQQRLDAATALEYYDRALQIAPNFALAHYNRGYALEQLGRPEEAEQAYRDAIARRPDIALAHLRLGAVLQGRGQVEAAIEGYRRASSLNTDWAQPWYLRGNLHNELLQFEQALECFRRALELDPNHGRAHYGMGVALTNLERRQEGIAEFREATRLGVPDIAEVQSILARVLYAEGLLDESRAAFEEALSLNPNSHSARFGYCTSLLPLVYGSDEEVRVSREGYRKALERMVEHYQSAPVSEQAEAADAVADLLPFYLTYQGFDDRDLQEVFGRLVCKLMARRYPQWTEPPSPLERSGRKLRIGFLSAYFLAHSNWKIPIRGWAQQLDREQFELFGYHVGKSYDDTTDLAAESFTTFTAGPLPLADWCELIREHCLDVLVFPEIGMDPLTFQLAALRLAPIQVSSWGHPQTSGMPTVDYFLSSDAMEPSNGQDHYSETLVRLANLSIHYEPVEPETSSAEPGRFGLSDQIFFWCCQSLFKYLPRDDDVLIKIAERLPKARFVFIQDPRQAVTEQLERRLRAQFGAAELDVDQYCVFLPRKNFRWFAIGAASCDACLDCISWSGCNSTLETLAQDCPVVTLPGEVMRSRHTAAILEQMGLPELIARDKDDYVDIAVRLAEDEPWRESLRRQIRERKSRLYEDLAPVRALEGFFLDVAGGGKAAD